LLLSEPPNIEDVPEPDPDLAVLMVCMSVGRPGEIQLIGPITGYIGPITDPGERRRNAA
jgi:hypothetical protein